MRDKPTRTWTTRALWQAPGPITLFARGEPLAALLGNPTDPVSPVEYQLIAVAGCFALSLEAARKVRGWPECVFDITAVGSKAHDLPSRLERITLNVAVSGSLDAASIATLIKDAKRLCTVTNTLANPPTLDVGLAKQNQTVPMTADS